MEYPSPAVDHRLREAWPAGDLPRRRKTAMGDHPGARGCIHAGRRHRTQIPSSLNRPPHQSQRPTLRGRRKRIVGTPIPVMTNIALGSTSAAARPSVTSRASTPKMRKGRPRLPRPAPPRRRAPTSAAPAAEASPPSPPIETQARPAGPAALVVSPGPLRLATTARIGLWPARASSVHPISRQSHSRLPGQCSASFYVCPDCGATVVGNVSCRSRARDR
jgi:predicted RNA-binding Zn-ribbon protein involved in translation (DUF1610 family)